MTGEKKEAWTMDFFDGDSSSFLPDLPGQPGLPCLPSRPDIEKLRPKMYGQLLIRQSSSFQPPLEFPFLFAFSVGALRHFAVGPLAQDLAYFVIASKQADSLLNKHFVT